MKLSITLSEMILPLFAVLGTLPEELFAAMKRIGKRGARTYYPTDLRRMIVILDTVSDLTGRLYEIEVTDGNLEAGIDRLRSLLMEEEHLIEMGEAYAITVW